MNGRKLQVWLDDFKHNIRDNRRDPCGYLMYISRLYPSDVAVWHMENSLRGSLNADCS